jgi:thiamine-monophosphate kinase
MLVGRYRVPQPRNALAMAVRDHAHAAMDVSDGLAGDLAKLCAQSGLSAVIDAPGIPLSAPAAALLEHGTVGIDALVSGGDDYEILCAIPEDRFEAFAQAAGIAGVAVSSIGTVIAGSAGPKFLDGEGRQIALPRLSYSHF